MKLALFFTRGISLKDWDEMGHFTREVDIYNSFFPHFEEIYFLTYGGSEDLLYNSQLVKIKVLPNIRNFNKNLYSLLIPILNRRYLKEIDVYKTNQLDGSLSAVLSKFIFKKKLVVRAGYLPSLRIFKDKKGICRIILFTIGSIVELIAFKCADLIILPSENDKIYVTKKYKIKAAKIKVLPHGINTKLFKPLGIEKEPFSICFVGRLHPVKNLFSLLEALYGLNVKLKIIGDGEIKDELIDKSKKLRLNVEFKGYISNDKLAFELNKYELFILPSFDEANPKVILEAMACGLPVIGSNVGGIKQVIIHKQNGYLCQTNKDSIREAINELFNNKQLRENLGRNARKYILENHSLEVLVKKEVDIYKQLVNKTKIEAA